MFVLNILKELIYENPFYINFINFIKYIIKELIQ